MGKNLLATAPWVAKQLEEDVRVHQRSYTAKDIQLEVWKRFGVSISYWVAWSARTMVLELVNGNYEQSYELAPALADQILRVNPGSIATVTRHDGNEQFKGMCVSFSASIMGFVEGCRPLIGLDGCFLKGKYGGVCLAMVALDGNNGMFPLAVYICQSECKESWDEFLWIMKPHIGTHPHRLTFMSDMQKGLIEVVQHNFPSHNHRFCFRHLYKIFKKAGHNGKKLEELSWGTTRAYTMPDHQRFMKILENDYPQAHKYLVEHHVPTWLRAYFDEITCCEHITNNFSESFNNWILQLRDKPVCQFVEKLQKMVMTLLYERREKAGMWDQTGIVPRVAAIIEKMKKKVNEYIVIPSDLQVYSVQGIYGESWCVNLAKKTCDCRVWLLSGIPCIHAVCVIQQRRLNYTNYCNDYLSVKTYAQTYAKAIVPIPNQKLWEPPRTTVKAPFIYRPPGRPAKNRRKEDDEVQQKMKRNCKKCGLLGHNKRTCKGPPRPPSGSSQPSSSQPNSSQPRRRQPSSSHPSSSQPSSSQPRRRQARRGRPRRKQATAGGQATGEGRQSQD